MMVLAVHTSLVESLPHQITAVYEAMLPRQPLRFLLAEAHFETAWTSEPNWERVSASQRSPR